MEKVKECVQCGFMKPLQAFGLLKGAKDGRSDRCKDCANGTMRKIRKKKQEENPAEYLLYNSVQDAFYRGQPHYMRSPYESVLCKFKSVSEFYDWCLNNEEFMKKWRVQTDIYLYSGKRGDRPSIDRIDPNGHYSPDNIQMLPLAENLKKARSKPSEVLVLKDAEAYVVLEYQNITQLKGHLKQMGIPTNKVNLFMDAGKIYDLGNGYSMLIQTKFGQVKTIEPTYKLTYNYKDYIVDAETGKREFVRSGKMNTMAGGLRFTHNKGGIQLHFIEYSDQE